MKNLLTQKHRQHMPKQSQDKLEKKYVQLMSQNAQTPNIKRAVPPKKKEHKANRKMGKRSEWIVQGEMKMALCGDNEPEGLTARAERRLARLPEPETWTPGGLLPLTDRTGS